MPKRISSKHQAALGPFYTTTSPQVGEDLTESQAEEIVNRYGEALLKINKYRSEEFSRLLTRMFSSASFAKRAAEDLERKAGPIYNFLTQRADKSSLPYPKERIREAIQLLLHIDKDPDNIELLKVGLRYLDYFI